MIPKILAKRWHAATDNTDRLDFNFNATISDSLISSFYLPLRDSSEKYLDEIGERCASVVRKLVRLPGIKQIVIHPRRITLELDPMFDGKKIEPCALHILKHFYAYPNLVQVAGVAGYKYVKDIPIDENYREAKLAPVPEKPKSWRERFTKFLSS